MKVFDHQHHRYAGSSAVSHYTLEDGKVLVPLSKDPNAPGPHFLIVRRHAPTGLRRTTWRAAKTGTPPVYPELADTPSGDVLLSASVSVVHPENEQGQQTRAFMMEGEYLYAQCGPLVVTSPGQPAPLQQRENIARGGRRQNFKRVQPLYNTGRPPFVRLAADGLMLVLAGIALIPFVGRVLEIMMSAMVDAFLDKAAKDQGVPQLVDHTWTDQAVDVRPVYASEGLVR